MTAPTDICAIVSFPAMNSAQDNISGQQLFLASSEVLKHVLLPRLSGADLVRLGLTCRAIHSWVLDTPSSLWQVGTVLCKRKRKCSSAAVDSLDSGQSLGNTDDICGSSGSSWRCSSYPPDQPADDRAYAQGCAECIPSPAAYHEQLPSCRGGDPLAL